MFFQMYVVNIVQYITGTKETTLSFHVTVLGMFFVPKKKNVYVRLRVLHANVRVSETSNSV